MKSKTKNVYKRTDVYYNLNTQGGEKMKLSFKWKLKKANSNAINIITELEKYVKNVCNNLLSDIKEEKEIVDVNKSINIATTPIYTKYRKENENSKYLHSHMLQEAIMSVIGSYKSYKRLEDMYSKDPKSLKGEPQFPKFKQIDTKQEIIFTKYAVRIEGNIMKLSLSKEMKEKYQVNSLNFLIPRKLRKLVNFNLLKMIRVRRKEKELELNIVYEKGEKEMDKEKNTNIMAIDLGLNNIAACTNLNNANSLLISGKTAKSVNRYYNNKIAYLQKIQMLSLKNSEEYKNTKQIKRLYEKRNNYMNTFMHKVSKMIVEYAKENNCNTIVLGNLKEIKKDKKNMRNFTQIPIQSLVEKIEYKSKLEGIKVHKIDERYTSGVSALDEEEIIKENYNKKRRVHRGLFVTNKGIKVNADINGSLNILRKYIKKRNLNQEIEMGIGREQRPLKRNVT